jgi:hypothetical protein
MSDNNKNPGGIIWAPGIHNVYLNRKPTKVYVPQYGVHNTYGSMKKQIERTGSIKLGVDHIQEQFLKDNPILNELLKESNINPHDVGDITDIALENDQIKIIEAKITNPTVQKLYDDNKLPAFSLVGNPIISPCLSGKADVVSDDFSQIPRVDFVTAGGCVDCKTNQGMLTAKLSMEENNMVKYENINVKDGKIVDKTKDKKGNLLVDKEGKKFKLDKEGIVEFKDNKPVLAKVESEPEPTPTKTDIEKMQETVESQAEAINTLKTTVEGFASGEIKVEAKLPKEVQDKLDKIDDLTLEAKSAKVETKIDAKIVEGFATPAMKEGLLEAGNALPDTSFDKMLDGLKTKLWEGGRISEIDLEARDSDDGEISEEDYYKGLGLKKPE